MPLNDYEKKLTLTVTGDPDGSGTSRTARFEMVAGDPIEIQQQIRTGTINSGTGQLLTTFFNEVTNQGGAQNEEVVFDLGTGQHAVEIRFSSWAGGADFNGNTLQWGDTGDATTLTNTDATGEHGQRKMQCLFYWLNNTRIDSLTDSLAGSLPTGGEATLSWGQHSAKGVYDPLSVFIEQPGGVYSGAEPTVFTGDLTCIEIATLGQQSDASARTPRGT